ncbi:MAG: glycosyl transferase family protein [Novosphingobium sp.]
MESWLRDGFDLLQLVRHELLLFAAFWFIVGAADELAVDMRWLWLLMTGRGRSRRLPSGVERMELAGRAAVIVPAWREADVIGAMISHTLQAWSQRDFRLYVGCYCNDDATLAAAIDAAGGDPRIRIVVHGAHGPTTKADCLNRLYEALSADEARSGVPFRSVVMQDAEEMVHPAALLAIDRGLEDADFVQLPVRPELQKHSRWVAGHYADEFIEAHAKDMVVRDSLGAAIPGAGVGCGFSRAALASLARMRRDGGEAGPFAPDCLTEDYEMGVLVAREGGTGRFLRLRDSSGALVATRSFFPARLEDAVRQKTRWIHGIAFQGWDRLGWHALPVELWMALRDRRGPLTALVLTIAYAQILLEGVMLLGAATGLHRPEPLSPLLATMVALTVTAFVWRALLRFGFTAREYGVAEGALAVLRIPIANLVAILAGRRAFASYLRTLAGETVRWEKTAHDVHPAIALARAATA